MIRKLTTTLSILVLTLFVFYSEAQTVTYSDNQFKQGMNVAGQDKNSLDLNFSVNTFSRMALDVNGNEMEKINMPGSLLQNSEGNPDLPVISRWVAVPQGADVKFKVETLQSDIFTNVEIAPAPRIPLDTEKGPLQYKKSNQIYSVNGFFPASSVIVSDKYKVRGMDMVLISVSPFRYNPVSKELLVNRDMQIHLDFVGGNGHYGNDKYRNRFWDPIIFDMAINSEEIDLNYQRSTRSETDGCEYLIIVPNDPDFLAWADTIKVFRQRQGIITKIVTIDDVGGNTTSAIETYINDAYNNWDMPPAAVLLMADYGTSGNTITSPVYDNYCISDNKYADVDNDHLPDITFARMTARNDAELELMVHKALNYERNPPTNPDFYDHPITAMGWQTERWFQLCSEVIAGFFENELEKTPVRENALYQGSPSDGWSTATNTSTILNYFGPAGLGYIPSTPDYLTDWGGNATRINNDINAGAFLLQHRDHGSEDGWGEPSYTSANIPGTTNTDLTYVFSINCLTGKFNISGECFVEKFHRHQFGALGLLGATEVSYSFVNDTYIWGAYDYMWPNFMPAETENPLSRGVLPAFSNVAGKYFLQQSGWPYNQNNKEVTYYLFHAHGDAFTQLYYEVPQTLTVIHNDVILSGLDFFTVTANEGSFICLSVDNEIIGTAVATGGPVDVMIPSQEPGTIVDIVITKQNYYRYEESVGVIPPDGPYCIYDAHQINDSLGNGNTKPEYDETIFIDMVMENLGNENASNVNVELQCNNPFYTLVDSTEMYDSIVSGETVNHENAFEILLADNIPDQTELNFDVLATDENDSSWTSKMFITVNAPNITPGEMEIDDSEYGNDNGMLDPGENANIRIKTYNKGHCVIQNVNVSLVPYNNFITVNSEDQVIPTLGLLGGTWVEFNVDVAEDAPQAVIAEMHYTATAAGYEIPKVYYPKIGQFIEDWETGDFNKFDWVQGGDADWEITMQYPYQGFYHAISGDIEDDQTSSFKITYEVMANDVIRFMRKISCEPDFDELRFYIDGVLKDSWSGSHAYAQYEYPVGPGIHTFKWEYAKDYSGTGGMDKAWIDNIELPTMMVTTLFAGPDAENCANQEFQCEGSATNYSSIQWTSSGDGSFDFDYLLQPIYTPGEVDKQNGNVTLTMNVVDVDGGEFTDDMLLTFNYAPNAPEMPVGDDYVDVYKVTQTSYTTNPVDGATSYQWELLPEEAGQISGSTTEAVVNWNIDFLGDASLKVKAINDCGGGEYSEELPIFVDNTVGFNSEMASKIIDISPNPANGKFKLTLNSENNLNLKIVNYLGISVLNIDDIDASSTFTKDFDLTYLPAGIYLISVEQSNNIFTKKLIIQK